MGDAGFYTYQQGETCILILVHHNSYSTLQCDRSQIFFPIVPYIQYNVRYLRRKKKKKKCTNILQKLSQWKDFVSTLIDLHQSQNASLKK